jgi:hypothetical protein
MEIISDPSTSLEERIAKYASSYEKLFPINVDLEKVWEISLIQAESILQGDVAKLSSIHVLTELLLNLTSFSNSVWTRTISGSCLIYCHTKNSTIHVAVENLTIVLSAGSMKESNDMVLISMYALNLFKRIHQKGLFESTLESCTRSLEQSAKSSSANGGEDCCNSLYFNVLIVLISRGANLNSILNTVLGEQALGLLKRLFELLYEQNLSLTVSREQISKRLIFPLIQQVGNGCITVVAANDNEGDDDSSIAEQLVDLTWVNCLRLSVEKEADLGTCSSLLCVLMSVTQLGTMNRLRRKGGDLWKLLSALFLSSDVVVRKRAAFIMQFISRDESPAIEIIEPIIETTQKKGEKRKEKKNNKSKNKKSDSLIDDSMIVVDTESVILEPFTSDPSVILNGLSGRRPWWLDYLDVYGQIEGCTSMHLVDQIWPLLEHLCKLAADSEDNSNNVDVNNGTHTDSNDSIDHDSNNKNNSVGTVSNEGSGNESFNPLISFVWVKALLHILLRISIPGIRKAVLRRILLGDSGDRKISSKNDNGKKSLNTSEGVIVLSASLTTIHWICEELLPILDNVSFFSTGFLPVGVNVGCGGRNSNIDKLFQSDAKINVSAHPGVLMPFFLSRLLRDLFIVDSKSFFNTDENKDFDKPQPLTHTLVRALVHTVCGINGLDSLSAVKWVLRAFADPEIVQIIPQCLGPIEMQEIKSFLRGKLGCSNGVVRAHVLQGLLPVLLMGSNPGSVPLNDFLNTVMGGTLFQLDEIVAHTPSYDLLMVSQ